MLQGSILALNLRDFKFAHDENGRITDRTIGISILIVRLLNADFDGDEVHISLMLDNDMGSKIYPLEPKFSIYGMNKPLAISNNIALPKPVVAQQSNWLGMC